EDLPPRARWRDVRRQNLPATGWQHRLSEPNPLLLDFVRLKLDGRPWSKSLEVLKADKWLRQQLGWKPHSYFEVQPWKQPSTNGQVHRVQVKSTFQIEGVLPESLAIAFEHIPGLRLVLINN